MRFKLPQPAIKMRALRSNSGQPNFQRSKGAVEGLLVPWYEVFHSLGRAGNRRIVNILWRFKVIPNLLELEFQVRSTDSLAECQAVTEQQAFELMHHYERHEALRIET